MKKIILALLGLTFSLSIEPLQAAFYKAIEMAESSPIEQNRFYPRWAQRMSLSETYYGVPVDLYRPTQEDQQKLEKVVRVFLEDLFEQQKGGKARIFAPEGLINPVVLHDGREFFHAFWKDKVNNERHVGKIEIVGFADGHKWIEVWARFIETDRYPSIKHTNYIAMLIETPANDEPYLADCKVLGRTPTDTEGEQFLRKCVGLRKFATQPEAKTKREEVHPRLKQ